MRLSLRANEGEMDLQISGTDDAITVGDLFAAAGLGATTGPVEVDGRRCPASTPLRALDPADGAVIARRVEPGPQQMSRGAAPASAPAARLVSVAGSGAGRHRDLSEGTWDLCLLAGGPTPGGDRGAAAGTGRRSVPVEALVRIEVAVGGTVRIAGIGDHPVLVDGFVADETLRPGSWFSVGATVFRVGPRPSGRSLPATTGGTRSPFIRAPRVHEPFRSDPVLVPKPPPEPKDPEPISWLLLVLPLPMAVIMAMLFSPFFLVFTLMSPVTALGRSWDAKRRKRKTLAANAIQMDADLADFIDQLDRRRAEAGEARRATRPDLAVMAEMARTGDPGLWRSRSDHHDFLQPVIGIGPARWDPEIIGELATADLEAAASAASVLPMSPVTVDLLDGIAVGIVGSAEARRALAATVVSHLMVEHGPGDVTLAAFLDERSARAWDHLKWLPHLVDESGSARVATTVEEAEAIAARMLVEPDRQVFIPGKRDEVDTPVPVVLVDSDAVLRTGVQSLSSRFPRGGGRAVILADTLEQLPSFCTSCCIIGAGSAVGPGVVDLVDIGSGQVVEGIAGSYADPATVVGLSRSLARFVDPDSPAGAASLPDVALLTEVIDVPPVPAALLASWVDPPQGCRATLGPAEDRPLDVEFLRDGPHALVAGTTGAGKSELLRTMITSLAARYGPDRVTFVLIDFKGGGAFDVFADLPHNVGVVTDLDEHLSARALRCLQAELKYREHRLRDAGVSDLVDLPAPEPGRPFEPLPRLLIVVDEFATLAAELPDFMASLIDVAQRGRSLGIHMVLATQRPTGVVDGKIRANTNLRIALRVQDDGDSMDVIGGKAAAEIDRRHPGRALARFGAGELVGFQTALVSVTTGEESGPSLRLESFDLLGDAPIDGVGGGEGSGRGSIFDADGPTDLARYVAAACEATATLDLDLPRVPWPDPLPDELSAEDLLARAGDKDNDHDHEGGSWSTPFGLIDLPDQQCQVPAWWSPADGNVVFYGIEPGAAASSVATIVLGLANRHSADDAHVYVLDFAGSLAALRQLPHTGGYVNTDDDERLLRTLQLLEGEVSRRRRLVEAAQAERVGPATDLGEATPLIVVAIANYGGILELLEELGELTGPGRLAQIVRDGPALGMFVFIASTSERDVPSRVGQQIEARFVMRLADPNAYLMFGLKTKDVPELVPGRAVDTRNGQELQVARFGRGDLRHAVEQGRWNPGQVGPQSVPVLGDTVPFEQIAGRSSAGDAVWRLVTGIGADDLQPGGLDLRNGRHAIVTGPSGAGKTTTLQTIAAAARQSDPDAVIAVAAARPEEWAATREMLDLTTLDYLLSDESDGIGRRRILVVIDGFDTMDLPDDTLERAATRPPDGLHLVVAGRADGFRMPAQWVRAVMSHRTGVAINAAPEHGDLFRCRFPLPKSAQPAGRGYVVNEGIPAMMQMAQPPSRLTNSDMEGVAEGGQRRFSQTLPNGGVGVHGVGHVFEAGSHLDG